MCFGDFERLECMGLRMGTEVSGCCRLSETRRDISFKGEDVLWTFRKDVALVDAWNNFGGWGGWRIFHRENPRLT